MYHIIYQTTNLVNQKIYIGYHYQETDPYINDGYLGSGKSLLKAIKKYGPENFNRTTLYVFPDQDSALIKEGEIVNESFVKRRDVYNITLGGGKPPSHKGKPKTILHRKKIGQSQLGKIIKEETREKIRQSLLGKKRGPRSKETREKISIANKGRKHSTETRIKMSQNHADVSGKKNPMYGRTKESNPKYGKELSSKTKAKIKQAALESQILLSCPYCGHVGKRSGMQRWHMNNCRHNLG